MKKLPRLCETPALIIFCSFFVLNDTLKLCVHMQIFTGLIHMPLLMGRVPMQPDTGCVHTQIFMFVSLIGAILK
jgi:hypothetical protein